tara:strand:+ start:564 stop:1226 length:663 start_codon:yes stop_codon:yes gene_type:complete
MATLASFVESTAFGVLNNFVSEFNSDNGYALPSRYEVIITSPGEGDARKVSMRCEAIDLPGRALNTSVDTNMYGIAPEIVDGITFGGTLAMTFQSSSDLEERVFFESWQEMAWDKGTWNVNYYKDYISDSVDIYVLDQQDTRRYGLRLKECFPKEIGPAPLNYATAGDIIKIPVTLQYKYWETLDINNQPPNLMEKVLDTVISGAERSINANIPKVLSRL